MRTATTTTEGRVKTGTGWRSVNLDHPVPEDTTRYFFSVSAMIRLTSAAALLAATFTSPP